MRFSFFIPDGISDDDSEILRFVDYFNAAEGAGREIDGEIVFFFRGNGIRECAFVSEIHVRAELMTAVFYACVEIGNACQKAVSVEFGFGAGFCVSDTHSDAALSAGEIAASKMPDKAF